MDSGKVYMIVGGALAKVPQEYAKKVEKKQMLVLRAQQLSQLIDKCGLEINDRIASATAVAQLEQTMAQIRRLNRQIPPVIQFV